jgi:hypothetical protein
MQFKHPEILYALFLLVIPIIIHLFQLRRFQKVAFTNVQFLKNITLQTRKSSQLKKWLTLITRLLLLACAIIAFAQPFIANTDSFNTKNETVIYLDNSYSMQAKGSNGTLLNSAIQDLIEHIDEKEPITIFTNDITFTNTTIKAIKNDLIQLDFSPTQLDYEAVILKGKKAFSKDKSSVKNLLLVSDFQQKNKALTFEIDSLVKLNIVQLKPTNTNNIAIDSVFISKTDVETIELTVQLKNQGNAIETLPVSLFDGENLLAKTSVSIENEAETTFTLPLNKVFNGRIVIDDASLQYDNVIYINSDTRDKIRVLAINEADDAFLKKIYTEDEFLLESYNSNAINYNSIEAQNLIVLNQLKEIPNALITALKSFTDNGGCILIIPSNDVELNSYNQLFANYQLPSYSAPNPFEKRVTNINFSHPLLANVFEKQVQNFQYPKVNTHYPLGNTSATTVLSFEDNAAFLNQNSKVYAFTAAIDDVNSNFKSSPLIVPVLYNIGKQSLKLPQLYYSIGNDYTIDITTQLSQDEVLTLHNNNEYLVPLQQTFTNKVALMTNEYPDKAGIYEVKNEQDVLKNLSFNYQRNESQLAYYDISNLSNGNNANSIASALDAIKSTTDVNALWKWFAIFALAFLIIEMLILKFLK